MSTTIRRVTAGIAGVLAALFAFVLLAPQSAVTAGPAPAVQLAQAWPGQAFVINKTGSNVLVRCNYYNDTNASPYSGRLFPQDEGSLYHSDSYCAETNDVDQFRSEADARCIQYLGPGYADGYYKISANKWYKVSDLATVRVYGFYSGSPDYCSGRPYFTHV